MNDEQRRPYVEVVRGAREERRREARLQARARPVIPAPGLGEDLLGASNESLWQCGNKAFLVAPRTLRDFAAGVR